MTEADDVEKTSSKKSWLVVSVSYSAGYLMVVWSPVLCGIAKGGIIGSPTLLYLHAILSTFLGILLSYHIRRIVHIYHKQRSWLLPLSAFLYGMAAPAVLGAVFLAVAVLALLCIGAWI
ncbi:hypothetical protein ACFLX5_06240 [Chloroflexota bacterium]